MNIEEVRQKELWTCILFALNAAHRIGTTDRIVRAAISHIVSGVTELEIRKQIDYLAERKLIITEKYHDVLFSKINFLTFIDGTISDEDRAWIDNYEAAMTPGARDRWEFEKEMCAKAQA